MSKAGPRIVVIGGTYRGLCVIERLLERGERLVGFIGQEGSSERDFCPEILEVCDRYSVPARSAHKFGEEVVRWLEDRIRPDMVLAVGVESDIPLAVGGNSRLGLIELVDRDDARVILRQRGQEVAVRDVPRGDPDADAGDELLAKIDVVIEILDEFLAGLPLTASAPLRRVPFEPENFPVNGLERIIEAPEPGDRTTALEGAAAEYLGAERVLALRSTSEAFSMLWQALGLEKGDQVVCPPTCSKAAIASLQSRGAVPVFVDVEPGTLAIDPERIPDALTSRTRAVLVSHPFGQPAALDRIYPLAEAQQLEVVEDAGTALGARFADSRVGRSPCSAVFRMPLAAADACADAVLVTLAGELGDRLASQSKSMRLGDGGAALALELLDGLDERLSQLQRIGSSYSSELSRYDAFRIPPTPSERLPSYASYVLGVTRFARVTAEDLHKLLSEGGVETRRILLPARERELSELPVADQARQSSLILPAHAELAEEQLEYLLDLLFDYAIG